jgi:hypothetical protein
MKKETVKKAHNSLDVCKNKSRTMRGARKNVRTNTTLPFKIKELYSLQLF